MILERFIASSATGDCSYFIEDLAEIGRGNYNSAKETCANLGASLAIIKNFQQQEVIFNLTRQAYGRTNDVSGQNCFDALTM